MISLVDVRVRLVARRARAQARPFAFQQTLVIESGDTGIKALVKDHIVDLVRHVFVYYKQAQMLARHQATYLGRQGQEEGCLGRLACPRLVH